MISDVALSPTQQGRHCIAMYLPFTRSVNIIAMDMQPNELDLNSVIRAGGLHFLERVQELQECPVKSHIVCIICSSKRFIGNSIKIVMLTAAKRFYVRRP